MTDLSLLIRAVDFAANKHRDQRRKDIHTSPYINHPIRVAHILSDIGMVNDVEVLMSAVLHDTVEDTETTLNEIEDIFGKKVAEIVAAVTDDKTLSKAERKKLQLEHASTISAEGALVKIADKISNITDIANNPPEGWSDERRREYLNWAEQVVNNCPKVNTLLEEHFAKILATARNRLGIG